MHGGGIWRHTTIIIDIYLTIIMDNKTSFCVHANLINVRALSLIALLAPANTYSMNWHNTVHDKRVSCSKDAGQCKKYMYE